DEVFRPLTEWNPTISGLTVGNGSLFAGYERHGRWIEGEVAFSSGSSSAATTTLGIPLPVTPRETTIHGVLGIGNTRLTAEGFANNGWPVVVRHAGGTAVVLNLSDASAAVLVT